MEGAIKREAGTREVHWWVPANNNAEQSAEEKEGREEELGSIASPSPPRPPKIWAAMRCPATGGRTRKVHSGLALRLRGGTGGGDNIKPFTPRAAPMCVRS